MRGGDAGHGPWHLRFDGGRQQRYLADRREVLRYVLDIGRQSADPRFEVWAETEPPRTAGGAAAAAGRSFSLVEVLDLSLPEVREQVRAELDRLADGARSAEGVDTPGSSGSSGSTGSRDAER
jgi:hypothetical protein